MAGPIRIAVLANANQAKREIDSVGTRGQRMQRVISKAGKIAAAGLLVVGAAAVHAGQAAAQDELAQTKLAQTLRTGAKASAAQIAQTERFITAAGKAYGVADDDLRPALGKLAIATGSVEKAQRLANIAMNVSAGSGKNLEAVSQALAKAQTTGNVAALAKYGVATKDAHGKTLSLAKVTQDLANKYKGAASKAATTTAGKQRILQVQLGELQEQIGAKLLPVMNQLVSAGLKVIDWASKNTNVVKPLAIAVGAVAGAVIAANVAMKAYAATMALFKIVAAAVRGALLAWRVAQLLLNIAIAANPIGVIITAVVAVAGALFLAYKKSGAFREAVQSVGDKARDIFGKIKGFIDPVFSIIKKVATWVGTNVYNAFESLKDKAGAIADKLGAPFKALYETLKKIYDKAKSIIDLAFGKHGPRIDLDDLDYPNKPKSGKIILAPSSSQPAVQIHVYPAAYTNPVEIGRETAKALRAYLDVGGVV